MTFLARIQDFSQTRLTGAIEGLAALLCLVPAVGFLLAWHMQLDLKAFTTFVTVPALLALMGCELWMAAHRPTLLKRVAAGLVGGIAATAVFDAVRLGAAALFQSAPDHVPMVGQHLLHETIGIAPTAKALLLGYGYHYFLVGALLGVAVALVAGRVRRSLGLAAGLALGTAFAWLPQMQLLSVGTGHMLDTVLVTLVAASAAAGLVYATVLGRVQPPTKGRLHVHFLRQTHAEIR